MSPRPDRRERAEAKIATWLVPAVIAAAALNFFGSMALVFFWLFGDLVLPDHLGLAWLVTAVLGVACNTVLSIVVFIGAVRVQLKNHDWRGTVCAVSSFLCFGGNATATVICAMALSLALHVAKAAEKIAQEQRQVRAALVQQAEEMRQAQQARDKQIADKRESADARARVERDRRERERLQEFELAQQESARRRVSADEAAQRRREQMAAQKVKDDAVREEKRKLDASAQAKADQAAEEKRLADRERDAATRLKAAYRARADGKTIEAGNRFKNLAKDFAETAAGKEAADVIAGRPVGKPAADSMDGDEREAAAKLQIAELYIGDGKKAKAYEKLDEILAKYPMSKAAAKAKELRAELDRKK